MSAKVPGLEGPPSSDIPQLIQSHLRLGKGKSALLLKGAGRDNSLSRWLLKPAPLQPPLRPGSRIPAPWQRRAACPVLPSLAIFNSKDRGSGRSCNTRGPPQAPSLLRKESHTLPMFASGSVVGQVRVKASYQGTRAGK